jgi:integrase
MPPPWYQQNIHTLVISIVFHSTLVWKRVRKAVGLTKVRVHDLKHTFGRRLRASGVPLETRKVLLGHQNGDITSYYSAPELEELISATNRVCEQKSGKTPALVILERKAATG